MRKRESRPHVSGRVELLDDLVDRRLCHGVLLPDGFWLTEGYATAFYCRMDETE